MPMLALVVASNFTPTEMNGGSARALPSAPISTTSARQRAAIPMSNAARVARMVVRAEGAAQKVRADDGIRSLLHFYDRRSAGAEFKTIKSIAAP
mmetsp:Transcript_31895/g.98514  ORF Transcript_31895/g.98514 Transcript_31895/m.98514 type:complete len:95 (+) Transcript_31895:112-396(+)